MKDTILKKYDEKYKTERNPHWPVGGISTPPLYLSCQNKKEEEKEEQGGEKDGFFGCRMSGIAELTSEIISQTLRFTHSFPRIFYNCK